MNTLTTLTTQAHVIVASSIENPIGGIIPDFSVFGAEFTEWWQKLFTALWAGAIIVTLALLLTGVVQMATAGENPGQFATSRSKAFKAGIALIALIGFGVIVGVIIALAG